MLPSSWWKRYVKARKVSELQWDLNVDLGCRVRNLGRGYRGAQTANTSQACLLPATAPVYSSGPAISLPTSLPSSQMYNPTRRALHPKPVYHRTSSHASLHPGSSLPLKEIGYNPLCRRTLSCHNSVTGGGASR